MDPGGSQLDGSLPQSDNPCLIVEDSQPDSIALEDDPETSYRALLSKRLSNLQPHASSPVLEVITSPPRESLSQKENQTSLNHINHSATHKPEQSFEASQELSIGSLPNNKRTNMEDMESGADSTTCAQTEEGTSQFGLLELSESQGFPDEPDGRDGPKTVGANSQSQDMRRSEVSSSSKGSQRLSIQALLHSQAADGDDLVSSQDDLFKAEDEEGTGTRVDSTVDELANRSLPTSTPANSLHLLHLSGQGTLVQESLSQQSVDFVAATQERMSQTPLIVPSSPTGDEPPVVCKNADNPAQRGVGNPKDGDPVSKPRPTSTPVSQNSPGFVLDKSLPLPSQPEFSHDVFMATPSQEQASQKAIGPSQSQSQSKTVKSPSTQLSPTPSLRNTPVPAATSFTTILAPSPVKHSSSSSQSRAAIPLKSVPSQTSEVAASFQLELSSSSQPSILFQRTQSFLMDDDEDSQATQIEELDEGPARAETDAGPGHVASGPQASLCSGQSGPKGLASGSRALGHEMHSSQPNRHTKSAGQNVNAIYSLSQGSTPLSGAKPHAGDSFTTCQLESAAMRSSNRPGVPQVMPSIVASQSLSQSMLSVHSGPRMGPSSQGSQSHPQSQSQPLSQPKAVNVPGSPKPRPSSQPLSPRSQGSAHSQERTLRASEEMEVGMEKQLEEESTVRSGASGLCLALSQSQNLEPEPMDQDVELDQDQLETQPLVPRSQITEVGKPSCAGSPLSPQKTQRLSQQQQQHVHQRDRERGASASQPSLGICSPEKRREAEKTLSPGRGSLSQPERGSKADSGPRQSQGLIDSSGDIPFHFTLPKEGELIRPVVTATPPLISQLKKTPRHSTPIEMTSFSEASEGDVTRGTNMVDSELMVEDNMEALPATSDAEASGKLSLRMKLVTPVEEGSSGSERFSLQKPPLLDDDGSVVKATAVAKAESSSSVFSRVREARRQEEAQPSLPPVSPSDLLNSPLRMGGASQDSQSSPLMTSTQNHSQDIHQSHPISPSSQRRVVGNRTLENLSQPANGASTESPTRNAPSDAACQSLPVDRSESASSSRTPVKHRAVSQQTSFEATTSTSHKPSQGEPELSPPRPPPGVRLRRHVRTIQEVRTTVTRIITDVYYEDGHEVERKVTEESEEPVVDCRVLDSDISPSRTGNSSLTSGDLADISSLSSKASSLAHSSSGSTGATQSQGSGRRHDFAIPAGRGGGNKSGSPRRGRKPQQRPDSEQAKVQGSRPLTPVTPRGRSRRGRPPSRSPQSRGGRAGAHNVQPGPYSSSLEEEDEHTTRVASGGRTATPPPGTSSQPGLVSSDSSLVGLRVVAKWSSNGYFYSGRITSDMGSGRFRLLFDDSYECEVQGRDILLCDPIPIETEVTAISEDEYFCSGVVKGHKRLGRELQYCVEREGQQQWYNRASIILSMEQGSRLREQYGLDPYEPLTPLTKAADISLDNLVDGKRRRRSNAGPAGNTPKQSSSTTSSPRTPGPSGKRKLVNTAEEERTDRTPAKRGRKSGPGRAGLRAVAARNTSGRDAAGAGTGVCNTSGSCSDAPSEPSDLVASHGPLPTSDSLFMGFVFLLTASSFNDRLSNLALSEEEQEYLPTTPYNKHYISSQLEAGGGLVLIDFNEEQCKAAYQSLLIADQHCRTRKFLLSVAGGVPCVSNIWVRDCCQQQKLLNYRNYLLPAGLGPEQRVVEWHSRSSPFKGLRILLVFQGSTSFWAELLRLGGADSVKDRGETETDIPADVFDVVVTERSCPAVVLKSASSLSLPLVSLEWLVQSVIVGECQGFSADPQYCYDYNL